MARETLFFAQSFRRRAEASGQHTREAPVGREGEGGGRARGRDEDRRRCLRVTGEHDSEFDPPVVLFKSGRLPNDLEEAEVLGEP
jgi:hypothetical protein